MKIIVIGDIHGKDVWKKAVALKNPEDIVVFIGDYLDSFEHSVKEQVENFKQILEYKKTMGDKCVLLLGNHDFHYSTLCSKYERYSGYREDTFEATREILRKAILDGTIKAVFNYEFPNGTLYSFSHAGITKAWLKRAGLGDEDLSHKGWEDRINSLLIEHPEHFAFAVGGIDPTGDDVFQSPIWVRPDSLMENKATIVNQVVGHTRKPSITSDVTIPHIHFVDVLDYADEFLMVEETGVKIIKL